MKIRTFGAELKATSLEDKCPLCGNITHDSLLPSNIPHIPMNIEENVMYLESQKKMLNVYITGFESNLINKETQKSHLYETIFNLRQEIRFLKKELISDDRLPSGLNIRRKITLETTIETLSSKYEVFLTCLDDLEDTNHKLIAFKAHSSDFDDGFSDTDIKKLQSFEDNFKLLLGTY